MPPGNTQNKAPVVERCTYCGKSSCKGESSHYNYAGANFPATISPAYASGSRSYPQSSQNVTLPEGIQNIPTRGKLNNTTFIVSGDNLSQPTPKADVLPKSSNSSDFVESAKSNKNEHLSTTSLTQVYYKNVIEEKQNDTSNVDPVKGEVKVDDNKDLNKKSTDVAENVEHDKIVRNEFLCVIPPISKVKEERKLEYGKNTSEIISNSSKDGSECNERDFQISQKKHSKGAAVLEGVVVKITGSRVAEVRIYDADREPKFAQLNVDKLSPQRNAPPYAPFIDMSSVLHVGEVIKLVCTNHKNKDSGFYYFAHEAWKTESEAVSSSNNYDAESDTSYQSRGSRPESERPGSKSSSRRHRRAKKVTIKNNSNDIGDVVHKWLDDSEVSLQSRHSIQPVILNEGCEYFGKVIELRLPYAFVVEVRLEKSSECVFVFSKYFYHDGPNSKSLDYGVTIKGLVNIGDDVVVVPYRGIQSKEREFEWIAKKAWLKGKVIGRKQSVVQENQNISVPTKSVESYQPKESDFVILESDHDGAILSLQVDWGLVRELKNGSVYVFTRKNAYLFGLCLKNFVLEDVFKEGQLIKFSQNDNERGQISAGILYYGYQLPDFKSFRETICDYCREGKIKYSVERSLIMHGEGLYFLK